MDVTNEVPVTGVVRLVGLTLALGLLTSLGVGMGSSAALGATGSLSVDLSKGITGEARKFTGNLGAKGARPIVLQRLVSPNWTTVSSARTDTNGRFAITTKVRTVSTTYRVHAPKTKLGGKWLAARTTPSRKLTTEKQTASMSRSHPAVAGATTTVTWTFAPARAGRMVTFLLRRGAESSWTTLGSGRTSSTGKASFTWTPAASGSVTLRAHAGVHTTGAVSFSSERTITVAPAPSAAVDLTNWKLTLPIGSASEPDKAIEIKHPHLPADQSEFFRRTEDNSGIAFKAHTAGATTSGSSYPRSELREMTDAGDEKADWDSTLGEHVMTVTGAITHLPDRKPHVVAAQIHDAEDDIVMVRLENKHLFVEADGDPVGTLDSNYQLGTRFTVAIRANADGVKVSYNGTPKVNYDKAGKHWYFKAGCYTQASSKVDPTSSKYGTGYGEVVIYALTVKHT